MTERLQSAHDWAAEADVMIVDPDGWRKHAPLGERSMDDLISEDEFTKRLSISTIGPASWLVTASRADRQPHPDVLSPTAPIIRAEPPAEAR